MPAEPSLGRKRPRRAAVARTYCHHRSLGDLNKLAGESSIKSEVVHTRAGFPHAVADGRPACLCFQRRSARSVTRSRRSRSELRTRQQREVKMTSLRLWHVALSGALLCSANAPAALAQAPAVGPTAANPWTLGAPFPDPSEEVLGATANGKLYVFAGLAPGWKPKSLVFE